MALPMRTMVLPSSTAIRQSPLMPMNTRFRPYEPWFRAWLILAPLVAWGSHFIIFNARMRLALSLIHI